MPLDSLELIPAWRTPAKYQGTLLNLTTAQRDLLPAPSPGFHIFNTTTSRPNFYDGSSWLDPAASDAVILGADSSDTQVLFNDSATIAGDAGLTYNKTTNFLTVTGGGITLTTSTINKLTLTPPATAATLTLVDGTTVTGPPATATLAGLGISNAGHLLFVDNTYDIGASGATRPRSLYLASQIDVTGTAFLRGANGINLTAQVYIISPADGILKISNNANDDFGRLQFGGTTSSFPALKRSTTSLLVRLADDSADASLTALLVGARPSLATPAAASAVAGVTLGSALVGIYWGTGSPNTALTAPKGSLYLRTDGSGVADRAYINTDASTAWTNLVTAG